VARREDPWKFDPLNDDGTLSTIFPCESVTIHRRPNLWRERATHVLHRAFEIIAKLAEKNCTLFTKLRKRPSQSMPGKGYAVPRIEGTTRRNRSKGTTVDPAID